MNYYCVLAMFISIFIATILVAPSTMANYIEAGKFHLHKVFCGIFFFEFSLLLSVPSPTRKWFVVGKPHETFELQRRFH